MCVTVSVVSVRHSLIVSLCMVLTLGLHTLGVSMRALHSVVVSLCMALTLSCTGRPSGVGMGVDAAASSMSLAKASICM